jgi:hypothetical protein
MRGNSNCRQVLIGSAALTRRRGQKAKEVRNKHKEQESVSGRERLEVEGNKRHAKIHVLFFKSYATKHLDDPPQQQQQQQQQPIYFASRRSRNLSQTGGSCGCSWSCQWLPLPTRLAGDEEEEASA